MALGTLAAELAKGGGRYVKWESPQSPEVGPTIGTTVTGTVIVTDMRAKRKYGSVNETDTWDNGDAKLEVVVTLATSLRDPSDPEDDGTRRVTLNLWGQQKAALIAACKAAGVSEPMPGMTFSITHTAGHGGSASPREFAIQLSGAPNGSLGAALGAAPAPAAAPVAQPVAVAAPVAQPTLTQSAPAPAPVANPAQAVETAKALLGAGMSHPEVAAATGLPATTIAALANLI